MLENRGMLVELDEAMMQAEADDQVRVSHPWGSRSVILRWPRYGFACALGGDGARTEPASLVPDQRGHASGNRAKDAQEWHYFFRNTQRWRDLRKITLAEVKGPVFAAGLMLLWACGLIIAADDVVFADVVGTRLGMCGVEYFGHPWEFGPRKAKELLLTGDSITAQEAYTLGMVSRIFSVETLEAKCLDFARRIAELPTMTALLIKESVNQTVDAMGFHNALNSCFSLHELNHAYWGEVSRGEAYVGTEELGVQGWRRASALRASVHTDPSEFADVGQKI